MCAAASKCSVHQQATVLRSSKHRTVVCSSKQLTVECVQQASELDCVSPLTAEVLTDKQTEPEVGAARRHKEAIISRFGTASGLLGEKNWPFRLIRRTVFLDRGLSEKKNRLRQES